METVKVMESAAAKKIPVDEVRGLRQKMRVIRARISYREKALKRLRAHAENTELILMGLKHFNIIPSSRIQNLKPL